MPNISPRHTDTTQAFALGGLAGGNGFGAGFLSAVQEAGWQPATISCTSGMIIWTLRFLEGQPLRERFMADWKATPAARGIPNALADGLMAVQGLPGVFRPALPEYLQRWLQWPLPTQTSHWLERALPVQTAVPTRDESFFDRAATVLEGHADVAVLFNAFCPHLGEEYVFANAVARERLCVQVGTLRGQRRYLDITPDALRAALHLYSYGYDRTYFGQYLVDGAYHRQFLLDELAELPAPHKPQRIWAVRPQNSRWIGEMPRNQLQQRDLETEIGMNSSYAQQVARLAWVNRLLDSGKLQGTDYRKIELKAVEYPEQRGFFDYFNESPAVFDCGHALARAQWAPLAAGQPA